MFDEWVVWTCFERFCSFSEGIGTADDLIFDDSVKFDEFGNIFSEIIDILCSLNLSSIQLTDLVLIVFKTSYFFFNNLLGDRVESGDLNWSIIM